MPENGEERRRQEVQREIERREREREERHRELVREQREQEIREKAQNNGKGRPRDERDD